MWLYYYVDRCLRGSESVRLCSECIYSFHRIIYIYITYQRSCGYGVFAFAHYLIRRYMQSTWKKKLLPRKFLYSYVSRACEKWECTRSTDCVCECVHAVENEYAIIIIFLLSIHFVGTFFFSCVFFSLFLTRVVFEAVLMH